VEQRHRRIPSAGRVSLKLARNDLRAVFSRNRQLRHSAVPKAMIYVKTIRIVRWSRMKPIQCGEAAPLHLA
jgi:hypothetical protein